MTKNQIPIPNDLKTDVLYKSDFTVFMLSGLTQIEPRKGIFAKKSLFHCI